MDEKSFEIGHHPNRKNDVVYARSIEDVPSVPTVKHPAKLHVAAAVCAKGRSELHIFKENLTAALYKDILATTILPAIDSIFGAAPWILLQDSDPKHTSKLAKDLLDENNINYFPKSDWPANSPDLNVMDNVWAMPLDGVNKKPPATLRQLELRLKSEWEKLPESKISNSVKSMPDRLKAIITARGDSIKY